MVQTISNVDLTIVSVNEILSLFRTNKRLREQISFSDWERRNISPHKIIMNHSFFLTQMYYLITYLKIQTFSLCSFLPEINSRMLSLVWPDKVICSLESTKNFAERIGAIGLSHTQARNRVRLTRSELFRRISFYSAPCTENDNDCRIAYLNRVHTVAYTSRSKCFVTR